MILLLKELSSTLKQEARSAQNFSIAMKKNPPLLLWHSNRDQRIRSTAADLRMEVAQMWWSPQKVTGATQTKPEVEVEEEVDAVVPMVWVCLLQTVHVPPPPECFCKDSC